MTQNDLWVVFAALSSTYLLIALFLIYAIYKDAKANKETEGRDESWSPDAAIDAALSNTDMEDQTFYSYDAR